LVAILPDHQNQVANRIAFDSGNPLAGPDAHAFQEHLEHLDRVFHVDPHVTQGALYFAGDSRLATGALPTLGALAVFAVLGEFFVAANWGYHEIRFPCGSRYNPVTGPIGRKPDLSLPRFSPARLSRGFYLYLD
jgi:hypothetical protein